MKTKSDEPLIPIAEAAKILNVSTSVIYRLVARHELEAVRIGASIRFHRDVVLQAYRFGTRPNNTRPYSRKETQKV